MPISLSEMFVFRDKIASSVLCYFSLLLIEPFEFQSISMSFSSHFSLFPLQLYNYCRLIKKIMNRDTKVMVNTVPKIAISFPQCSLSSRGGKNSSSITLGTIRMIKKIKIKTYFYRDTLNKLTMVIADRNLLQNFRPSTCPTCELAHGGERRGRLPPHLYPWRYKQFPSCAYQNTSIKVFPVFTWN